MHRKGYFCGGNGMTPSPGSIWTLWITILIAATLRCAHSGTHPMLCLASCCCDWGDNKVRHLKFYFLSNLLDCLCWLTAEMLQKSLCTVEGEGIDWNQCENFHNLWGSVTEWELIGEKVWTKPSNHGPTAPRERERQFHQVFTVMMKVLKKANPCTENWITGIIIKSKESTFPLY